MKIESLKQLQQLIALCQKTGVHSIKVDGIELELGDAPAVTSNKVRAVTSSNEPSVFDPGSILVPASISEQVETEELTEEQMLFYSSN